MKSKKKAKFVIGIDLGTTNCTVAYAEKNCDKPTISQFLIPQITRASEETELPFLPSFVYFPLKEELDAKSLGISWAEDRQITLGKHAKERAAECPDRVVFSAKSWLCHFGIDRREKILPISASELRLSPVDALMELLKHIRESWDQKMKEAFIEQEIFITVPASFDPSSRQLVEEAAKLAGYGAAVLLEEPQAAFYAWLHRQESYWREKLKVGDKILVVDIGGGTTDFSLISVNEEEGNLSLERIAVGSHLLLGGDNLDYALSYLVKEELESQGHEIDEWQFSALKASVSQAKEALLSRNAPETYPVTVMGRGSRLIGGTITYELSRQIAQELLVDGFFPNISFEEKAQNEQRLAFQEKGLPYAKDPRVTAQLASFLGMSEETFLPTAILFNGGTMKADAFRERLQNVLDRWLGERGKEPVKLLGDEDFDFSVSQGAVYYGLALSGKGIRIRSSLSQSYYVGIEEAMPAIPGREPPLKALCIAPYGMEEGSQNSYLDQEFALTIGKKVLFRFFCQNAMNREGRAVKMGTVVKNWKKELFELHPIETMLSQEHEDEKVVFVTLRARFTELGVLELSCESRDNQNWILEFDLRKEEERHLKTQKASQSN